MIEDHELSGYLDGELDPDRVQTIERALISNSEIAAQLERVKAANERLVGYSRALNYPITPQSLASVTPRSSLIRVLGFTALSSLFLIAAKFVMSAFEPWVASGLEILILVALLTLAIKRAQSVADDDLNRLIIAHIPSSSH